MTRQEIVIKIAKINHIIGEWKYRLDLDGEVEIETLSPDLLYIDEWVREIGQYIKQNPSPIFVSPNNQYRIYRFAGGLCAKT